jgi:dynein intermediate chain
MSFFCDRSPIHPAVFATASSNGTLGLWNLATSLDEPITGLQGLLLDKGDNNPDRPSHGVNRIKWSRDGRRVAAACSDTVHVLGITEELWKPKGNEGAKVMHSLRSRGLIDDEE